jgi:hypothetical protein
MLKQNLSKRETAIHICLIYQELSEDSIGSTIRKSCHKDVLLSIIMLITYEYIKLTEKVQRRVIKMFYKVNHCFIIMNA